ncbi:hypothetical protein N602_05170 [Mycobacterium avium subsp. hominissuis 10-5606]|jgi:hypothetical protein|nr:hypothetical protein N602_05170 [Mycobacterium avium subsp. hominissuis 10-5606]
MSHADETAGQLVQSFSERPIVTASPPECLQHLRFQ